MKTFKAISPDYIASVHNALLDSLCSCGEYFLYMENEIWKIVNGKNKSFSVSNYGNVKSIFGDLNIKKTSSGYMQIFYIDEFSRYRYLFLHQLVAHLFLDHDIDSKVLVVDHIDEDKSNNHVSNLQILTRGENIKKHFFLIRTGKIKKTYKSGSPKK